MTEVWCEDTDCDFNSERDIKDRAISGICENDCITITCVGEYECKTAEYNKITGEKK